MSDVDPEAALENPAAFEVEASESLEEGAPDPEEEDLQVLRATVDGLDGSDLTGGPDHLKVLQLITKELHRVSRLRHNRRTYQGDQP